MAGQLSARVTKRDLLEQAIQQKLTPKSNAFKEVCAGWIDEKFPNKSQTKKETFLNTFVVAIKRKFEKDAGRNTVKLLNQEKFKPFLAAEIDIKDDPVSPPKRPKMDPATPVPKPNSTTPPPQSKPACTCTCNCHKQEQKLELTEQEIFERAKEILKSKCEKLA